TALVSPFALLIPVSGIASGALFLGETLAPLQAVGAALVLVGLVVNVYGARLRRPQHADAASERASAPVRERLKRFPRCRAIIASEAPLGSSS
ncbi:MAG TPA: hypothetical protein VFM89_00320, partial [Casimicrobiaceae bacterium]|nr:hypothetical protein [Casimicrobiaceae bacterium]